MKIADIIRQERDIADIIEDLKDKSVEVPAWDKLAREYDPRRHKIKTDRTTRKNKVRKDGSIEKPARVTYGTQRMFARKMTQMAFSIPVKRIYDTGEDPEKEAIADAIEKIYTKARIDAVNTKRMQAYFAACEICTIWYTVQSENEDYGFPGKFKLRSMTFSPMDKKFSRVEQATLYPLIDAEDMHAMSLGYTKKEKGKTVEYFETYTSDYHYIWKKDNGVWQEAAKPEKITIHKIPASYLWRPLPIWEDCTENTSEIEYALSRESDILRKNSAPILKVTGNLIGDKKPSGDTAREVYQLENGGDVNYATWQQQVDAFRFFIDTLKRNMEEELQLPNLSLENIKSLGQIGEAARKTLLADAHLKVGDESGDIIEFLDRECNIIKAFLEEINTRWKGKTASVGVDHQITPFIQNDEMNEIEKISKATGGEPVASQKIGIKRLGWVEASQVDKEYRQIQAEQNQKFISETYETAE